MRRAGRLVKRCLYGSGIANVTKLKLKDKISVKLLVLEANWNLFVAQIKIFAAKLRGYFNGR